MVTPHYFYETAVAYSDLGADQRLSPQGLLRLLQEAASVASDDVGFGLKDISRTGVHWILSSWRVDLAERPCWRTPLRVETWPRLMDGFLSDREFRVWAGDREIARGTSRWVLVDAVTGRLTRITGTVRTAYEEQLDSLDLFADCRPVPGSGKTPEDTPVAYETTAGRRDIDTNRHVNNLHYLDYALEALPAEVYENLPSTLEISFRKQILLGTPLQCLYTRTEDGKHQVEIRSGSGGKIIRHAFVWLYGPTQ